MMSIFSHIVTGKSILFIPVYSMRSYETGKYNLAIDGNFHRVMSVIEKYKPKLATVLIPLNDMLSANFDVNAYKVDGVNIRFAPSQLYGENAKATRRSKLTSSVALFACKYDYIVSEPQRATIELMHRGLSVKLIYWCVATSTKDWPVWFVDEFKDYDRYISENVLTIVATEAQRDALGSKTVVGDFYIPKKKKRTIYFPFRASDPNYQFNMFKLIVNHLRARGYADSFDVLVADVNGSIDELPSYMTLVPSKHSVYQAILNGKPIVPYLEHMDRLPHISIYEMIEAGCRIVTWDCADARKYDTITTVTSYEGFENEIIRLIGEEV